MATLPLAMAIFPSLLLLWYFHSRDAHPEPTRVVFATFFLCILTIPAILLFAGQLSHLVEALPGPYEQGAAEAFLCAALPEEFFKFVVVYGYAARHKEFNEPMDGLVYGVAASLGFATLENVLYVGGGGTRVALLRAFSAVPGHAFTGAIMGYYVGRARFAAAGKSSGLWLALAVPMLLHGLYDLPLLIMNRFEKHVPPLAPTPLAGLLLLGTPLALLVEYRLARRFVERLRAEQLSQLPAADALSALVPGAPAGQRDLHPPASGDARPPSRLLSWLLIYLGGGLATGGGGLLLLLLIGLLSGTATKDVELGPLAVGAATLGLLPLLAGLTLFRRGVARLNRHGAALPRRLVNSPPIVR